VIPQPKLVHRGKLVRADGVVSPLCADSPRPIDLKRHSWTNRGRDVPALLAEARMTTCKVLTRTAADADLGILTSPAAYAYVTATCPCGACAHARDLDERERRDAADLAGDLAGDLNPEWGMA
jgi:hypothetical protein